MRISKNIFNLKGNLDNNIISNIVKQYKEFHNNIKYLELI